MKHPSCREVFAYWNELRGFRAAPERGEIEPGAIRKALGDAFILSIEPGGPLFRLAGTRVCALFGREMKGVPFLSLWDENSRVAVRDLLAVVADDTIGAVAGAVGRTAEGFSADLELLILPLRHRGRTHARMMGVLGPVIAPFWLGSSNVEGATLGSLRHVGASVEGVARPPARPAPGRHRLVVYEGGRS